MSDGKIKDEDEITSFLGNYGTFQMTIMILLSLNSIPSGYMGVVVVFVSDTPAHHCKVPINGTAVAQSSWIRPDSCSRYKLTGNWTEAAGAISNDTEPCLDGWDFSTEIYTATIVSEWNLVCDKAWKVPFSTSLYFVGVLFGTFFTGHLSDRFGRKPVYFFTRLLETVVTLIQATSNNWVMFCILNFLRGIGQISNYIVSAILGYEMLSQSSRINFTLLGNSLGFSFGNALLPLFAYFIRDWRMLLVATALPGFFIIPAWWVIPESPRWLLQKGRVEEAELVIHKAAKRNRVAAPEVIFKGGECLELMLNESEGEKKYTYVDLIRTPNMRNTTIILVFIWTAVSVVFYGLSLNISILNGNVYLSCFISAAIDMVTCVASRLLINHVPRPTFFFCTLMLSGIMLLIIQLVPEDMHVMFQALALLGRIGVSSAFTTIYLFSAELIPTVVRNMGFGIACTVARMGTIACPYVLYMGLYSKLLPYITFGTISIMAAALSLLLRDTRNSKIPDLISQVKPIRGLLFSKGNRYKKNTQQPPLLTENLTARVQLSETMAKYTVCVCVRERERERESL